MLRRSRFALVIVCLVVQGCSQWTVARGPTPQAAYHAITNGSCCVIRVEEKSGKVWLLVRPSLSGDSISGEDRRKGASSARVSLALTDLENIEYLAYVGQKADAKGAVLFVGAVAVWTAIGTVLFTVLLLAILPRT